MPEQNDDREVEAKFDCDAAAHDALERFEGIRGFVVSERRKRQQDDVYFDTDDMALVRAGASFRVRMLESGVLMTFKGDRLQADDPSEAYIASRVEDEVRLPDDVRAAIRLDRPLPTSIDASPLRRARALAPEGEFLPVARIENDRTLLDLFDETGARLELAIDRCRGTRLRDGRVVEFDGAELESKGADYATVVRLSNELQRAIPGLRPMATTKLGRTLG